MSDCLDNAQCTPTPSQAFPAPLPTGIPADTITYSFEGVCPEKSGLDTCKGTPPISVADALDTLESKLCTLNPKGISQAPSCSPIVVKNGVATPVSPLEALNCLPKLVANDTVFYNGVEWIVGQPVIDADEDCSYPCPPAPNLTLVSTGVNTATWQTPTTIAVTDTSSIDLTLAANTLSATVKLDPSITNIATIGPNGLKVEVPPPTPLDCATLSPLLDPTSTTTCYPLMADTPVRILSTGATGLGYRNLPVFSDATVVSDTATLDLTLTGNNVSGVVKVSPDNGNALVANANGLFVPTIANPTVSDTTTVDLTQTGNDISATVKVSPDFGNRLVVKPNGLMVNPIGCDDLIPLMGEIGGCFPIASDTPSKVLSTGATGIGYRNLPAASTPPTVSDTATIDLTQTGNDISGVVKVSTNAGNAVTVTPTGLFVPTPSAAVAVTVTDSPTVDLTLTGQNITATAIVAPTSGNILQSTPTGLFVPTPSAAVAVTVTDSPTVDLTLTGQDISAAVKISPDAGNSLVQNANGLFVPTATAGTPVTVTDTPSIDLTISGQNISASVLIDPIVSNRLSLGPNGLKVSPLDCSDISGLLDPNDPNTCYPVKADTPTRILSTGATGIGYRNLPAASAPPTVSDTSTLDLTQTGNDISGVVKVSTNSGNAVTVTPTGLFVPLPSAAVAVTVSDSPTVDLTLTGQNITASAIVAPTAGNVLQSTPTGLFVPTPSAAVPVTVSDTPSIDLTQTGNDISGVVKVSTNSGNAVTVTPTGLFVPLPSAAVAVTVSDSPTVDLTLTGQNITASAIISPTSGNILQSTPTGLFVPTPTGGGGVTYTPVDTNSIDTTIAGNLISSDLKLDPIAGNLLSVTANGTKVLLDCPTVTAKLAPSSSGGCFPTVVSCNVPDAVFGHKAGLPGYYALGRELYHAEAYPSTNTAQQTLSNTPQTLNDITSLMTLGDESGLCGLASFWDPTLSRFTIPRTGRYTVHWGLFMRLIATNGTSNNSSLYSGLRFIRPAGTVDGRVATGQANTLRGTQFTLNHSVPAQTADYHSTGSHTFLATAGTQLSLRAVYIAGTGATLSSLIVRGDSGHFSVSELPLRSYS